LRSENVDGGQSDGTECVAFAIECDTPGTGGGKTPRGRTPVKFAEHIERMMSETETATVGGGCFWCVEAAFEEIEGVQDVTSGYAGGDTENPTYREVCSGTTGHAEVVQVEYDSDELAYEDVLEIFFTVHDPTTRDREGPDVGSQYRSAIYYHDEAQRETVEQFIEELEAEGAYNDPIVTEVEPLDEFYPAEEKHQNYFAKNPGQPYCTVNITPKVKKVREKFAGQAAD
jgi:peptide-methionine (S)-S-oxide reductase